MICKFVMVRDGEQTASFEYSLVFWLMGLITYADCLLSALSWFTVEITGLFHLYDICDLIEYLKILKTQRGHLRCVAWNFDLFDYFENLYLDI